jgi:hypothetical protein
MAQKKKTKKASSTLELGVMLNGWYNYFCHMKGKFN